MATPVLFRYLSEVPWIIFFVVWIAGAFKTNRTAKSESLASRYGVMALVVTGFVFLFDRDIGMGSLDLRFVPNRMEISLLGILFTWLGVGLAIWARFYLGRYWSVRVTIKENHELIRSGPYSYLRHPIYSGILLAVIGSALEGGKWRGLVGFAFVAAGFSLKALKEESMLRAQFGETFEDHRRNAGFLLPRLR